MTEERRSPSSVYPRNPRLASLRGNLMKNANAWNRGKMIRDGNRRLPGDLLSAREVRKNIAEWRCGFARSLVCNDINLADRSSTVGFIDQTLGNAREKRDYKCNLVVRCGILFEYSCYTFRCVRNHARITSVMDSEHAMESTRIIISFLQEE